MKLRPLFRHRWRLFVSAAVLALLALPTAPDAANPSPPDRVVGRWLTESGNLEVEIAPCGPALCGTVVRVLANRSMQNPNAEMKAADSRPALGMVILRDFVPSGEDEWKGKIYNRENGKTYRCLMAPLSPTQLKIHGYVGLPLFGKTQVWRRVADSAAGTNQ